MGKFDLRDGDRDKSTDVVDWESAGGSGEDRWEGNGVREDIRVSSYFVPAGYTLHFSLNCCLEEKFQKCYALNGRLHLNTWKCRHAQHLKSYHAVYTYCKLRVPMDTSLTTILSKLPTLTVQAGPRDKKKWPLRLKEELTTLIQVCHVLTTFKI